MRAQRVGEFAPVIADREEGLPPEGIKPEKTAIDRIESNTFETVTILKESNSKETLSSNQENYGKAVVSKLTGISKKLDEIAKKETKSSTEISSGLYSDRSFYNSDNAQVIANAGNANSSISTRSNASDKATTNTVNYSNTASSNQFSDNLQVEAALQQQEKPPIEFKVVSGSNELSQLVSNPEVNESVNNGVVNNNQSNKEDALSIAAASVASSSTASESVNESTEIKQAESNNPKPVKSKPEPYRRNQGKLIKNETRKHQASLVMVGKKAKAKTLNSQHRQLPLSVMPMAGLYQKVNR